MRIYLRHKPSGLLYAAPDQWTNETREARAFKHSAEAMDTARERNLRDTEVLLEFEETGNEASLPLPW